MGKRFLTGLVAGAMAFAPESGMADESVRERITGSSAERIERQLNEMTSAAGHEESLASALGAYTDLEIVNRGERNYRAKSMLDELPELAPIKSVAEPRDPASSGGQESE